MHLYVHGACLANNLPNLNTKFFYNYTNNVWAFLPANKKKKFYVHQVKLYKDPYEWEWYLVKDKTVMKKLSESQLKNLKLLA